ncbi:MAG: hypothetical protein U0M70_08795 [Eubacteriales bacterium]
MACFVVPAAEAVIVKAIELHQKKKEMKGEAVTAHAQMLMYGKEASNRKQ